MLNPIAQLGLLAASGVLAAALAACSGGTTTAPSAPTSTAAAPTTAAASAGSTVATAPNSASAALGITVSANTASEAEIIAALQTAGVENADRWAEEVVEYRPYSADDAEFARLREELAKYNPDQATLEAIVSVLRP
jgi:1-aminocyclopropane-1-carboxylate deaminase/D-cysteine desulfhydrase-like pyridoxal-dependent ACC family enzyme